MTSYLLDANVVIAATISEHEHHDLATRWLSTIDEFVLCPMVEGALVRFLLRVGESGDTAAQLLTGIHRHPKAGFCPDSASCQSIDLARLQGHRQVTDAYLVTLAADNGYVLATFDRGMAATHPRHTELVTATSRR